ncbi:MAG: hypothetical protein GXO75_01495 [Calditrichaeota bacterium]|nr:hypothetical protein [Calditrichota bacterium]
MKWLNMFITAIFFFFLYASNGLAQNSCIICHKKSEDTDLKRPTMKLADDIHFKNGITCEKCHGGDANPAFQKDEEAAMDADKGFIGVPDKGDIPKLCSRCHSNAQYMKKFNPNLPVDQYQQYLTSQHGKRLLKGDDKVAVCSDCHGVHNIQPPNVITSKIFSVNIPKTCSKCHSDSVYMKDYGIPTDQYALYKKSVHGINLLEKDDRSSPSCTSCHGNHGAYPPGVTSVSNICGTCHVTQREMFLTSPHKEAFEEMDLPQCIACHGNHGISNVKREMLGVGENSFCINCHDEGSEGYLAAQKMGAEQDSLYKKIEQAKLLLMKAEKAGVEVSEGEFILKEAHNAFVKTQNSVHTFSYEKFHQVIVPGFKTAQNAVQQGRLALNEVQNRRRWLAIISILIFIVAISLYFKIKAMSKR